ncbi:hypothetical protein A8709_17375 [Paenibacillus pectinilyticus]|uniref:Lipoprotein n=1 Tax=Paenibacillus pectinilyticus TaxID=512399 RepID=A0A1C0ZZ43_9BACL|nr:hypothetical protein [Paenibacillus pectinilyticus]OCT13385.1 hypothetical protein A8709_17375 [Paenibacillus pectinilyticus]
MFKRKIFAPIGIVLILALSSACDNTTAKVAPSDLPSMTPSVAAITSPSSEGSPSAAAENVEKEDNSIRAIGTHIVGQLLVKPATKATVAPLGAPSCYGLETDFGWTGDYEVVWESKSDQIPEKVMALPLDFEIIQQAEEPIPMREFTIGETTIFAYTPRYTDCHALETYFFGVSDGKAFPVVFDMKQEQNRAYISQLPHRSFQVLNNELIVTGGYGAGDEFIEVYHFQYDSMKRVMVLKSTDQVKPNQVVFNS